MPYFLLPKMDGDQSLWQTRAAAAGAAGYEQDETAAPTRRLTEWDFPQVTRRWWVEEYAELRDQQQRSRGETTAAFELAAKRGKRYSEAKRHRRASLHEREPRAVHRVLAATNAI